MAVCLESLSVTDVTDLEGLPKSQIEELPLVMRKLELANEHKRQLRVETVRLAAKAEAKTNIPAESAMEVAKDIMGRFGEGAQVERDKLKVERSKLNR